MILRKKCLHGIKTSERGNKKKVISEFYGKQNFKGILLFDLIRRCLEFFTNAKNRGDSSFLDDEAKTVAHHGLKRSLRGFRYAQPLKMTMIICFVLSLGVVSEARAATNCDWEKDAQGNNTTKLIVYADRYICPDGFKDTATEIEIKHGVTTIGGFNQMPELISVSIPESVTSFGQTTFAGDSKLTSIKIPASVNYMMNYVFLRTGLTEIIIPDTMKAENVAGWKSNIFQQGADLNITNIRCVNENDEDGDEKKCAEAIARFLPNEEGKCGFGGCLSNVQKIGNTCVGKYFASSANDGTCVTKKDCTNNGSSVVNITTRKCMPTEDCLGIYTLDKENKRCSQIPGCIDFAYDACVCDNGWLGKEGKCVTEEQGCGNGYKDMGGFCNRVRYTPAEAAEIAKDDGNVVTLTFRK